MAIQINMSSIGSDISDPLQIWSSPDNVNWTLYGTATKAQLLAGFFIAAAPDGLYWRVKDTGPCNVALTFTDCYVPSTTTTTTASQTTTTTTGPTTTTTTTIDNTFWLFSKCGTGTIYNITNLEKILWEATHTNFTTSGTYYDIDVGIGDQYVWMNSESLTQTGIHFSDYASLTYSALPCPGGGSVYYALTKCIPNGTQYYIGPYTVGEYNSGDRVEGASSTFYTITSSQSTPYSSPYVHISVTATGQVSCP